MEDRPILVVDDDKVIRYIVSHVLRTCGYQVEQATNGQEALELISHTLVPPQLILLDITMPLMGGIETLQRLRAEPRTSQIPIVMLTGMTKYLTSNDRNIAETANAYLDKPFQIDRLISTVEQLLTTEVIA